MNSALHMLDFVFQMMRLECKRPQINAVLTSLGLKNVRGSDVVAQMDIDGDGQVSFEVRSIRQREYLSSNL